MIVGISIDDSPEQLQAFMKEYKMNYPVLQMTPDVESAWGPFYGYPTSFVVARDGSICTKASRPRDEGAVREGDQGAALITWRCSNRRSKC